MKVSPEAHSIPNMATISPADASVMSSMSLACILPSRGTYNKVVVCFAISQPSLCHKLSICLSSAVITVRHAAPGRSKTCRTIGVLSRGSLRTTPKTDQ